MTVIFLAYQSVVIHPTAAPVTRDFEGCLAARYVYKKRPQSAT